MSRPRRPMRRRRFFGRRIRRVFRRVSRRFARRRPFVKKLRLTTSRMRTTPMPDKVFVKLRYWDTNVFTTAGGFSGDAVERTYRGNSVFDPDQTGGGHQPTGYDQWTGFYNQYRVLASSIRWTVYRISTAAGDLGIPFVFPDVTAATAVTIGTINPQEQAYFKYRHILANIAGNKGRGTVKNYMTTKKMFPGQNVTGTDFTALSTGNPASQWYWNCGYNNSGAIETAVRFTCNITYWVVFFDRATLNVS